MDIEHYVFINKKVLQFVGLYPTNKVRSIFCVLCMLLIGIPQIIQIYQDFNDLNIVLEVSSVLLMILLGISKALVCTINSTDVEILINFLLTEFWEYAINNTSYNNLGKYAMQAKNITKGYLFLIFNALLIFFTLPLIDIFILKYKGILNNDSNNFPFMASYPDSFYEFPLYEITYISQVIATVICGLLILATDTLIATAVIHTCGHFVTLQNNLNNLNKSCNMVYAILPYAVNFSKIQYIQTSHHYFRFCELMENNFSLMLLLQTISSSLIICLVGVQVSIGGLTDSTKSMKYFSYLIMALSQLLLFCFPGDQLIYESSMVSKTVYSIKWYQVSIPIKSEICMMILRSQKPCYITAGKIYVMHLENFNAILNTSLSYFMVLKNFNT
ncbi:PREDICTED: odorant receptor 49b-like [Polistes dominula]|uniref:Odorant receptor n=1 Tax=Polistes dominula TaxID=743375 RepID=A0ABM1IS34_POLDO|nr:PREDICTED: odorant receptor 49b-like [Polistes dominula]